MRGGRGESGGQPPSVSFFPPGKRFTGLRHELPWLSEYSFTVPENVRIRDGRIHVPKIGCLAIRRRGGNPCPDAGPAGAVFGKPVGKWHVTVCCQVEAPAIADSGIAARVDMKLRQVAVVTTEGDAEIIHVPDTSLPDTGIKRNQGCMARQGLPPQLQDKAPFAGIARKTLQRPQEPASSGRPEDG